MNYEKKYKEALERAKGLLEGMDEGDYLASSEDIENIFPELAESEDERIRKELIAIYSVGAKVNAKTGDISDKDIVAWLEKQKEPDWAHSQKENEDNYVIRCLINGLRFYCADNEDATWGTDKFHMKVADIIKWFEEQKTFNKVTEECERMLCEHLKKKYEL